MVAQPVAGREPRIEEIAGLLAGFDVVDLSQTLEEGMPAHREHSHFFHMLYESYYHGDGAIAYQILMNEHSATHVDAPAHFMRDGHPQHIWIDEVAPTSIVGRAAMINVRESTRDNHFDVDVLASFEERNGPLLPGDIVLFHTGWSDKWAIRPDNKAYTTGFPGPSKDLIAELKERKVRAVGADTLAFDAESGTDYPGHWVFLADGVLIIENLTNLDQLPPFSLFVALPLKIRGGSASPIRAIAYVPRTGPKTEEP
jgi:kynurenine formamidase